MEPRMEGRNMARAEYARALGRDEASVTPSQMTRTVGVGGQPGPGQA